MSCSSRSRSAGFGSTILRNSRISSAVSSPRSPSGALTSATIVFGLLVLMPLSRGLTPAL